MFRTSFLIVAAALLLSACGYTRSEAVTVRDRSDEQRSAAPSELDPTPQGRDGTDSGPPPTALAEALEIASKGAPDEIAASVEYEDGRKAEFTFGQLDAIVQPSLADAQYRTLGDVAPTFDAQILNLLIFNKSVEELLSSVDVEVTDSDRAAAESALLAEVSGLLAEQSGDPTADRTDQAEKLFADVPHLQLILDTRAKQEAALGYYADISEPGEVPCVSHILVADEAAANDLLTNINNVADFASAATASSTDQGSSESGGVLGCVAAEQFGEPAFVQAVQSAEVGEVAGPIQTSLGWHLVLVTELQSEETASLALAEREFNIAIQARVAAAQVTVAEAVGSWDAETASLVPASS